MKNKYRKFSVLLIVFALLALLSGPALAKVEGVGTQETTDIKETQENIEGVEPEESTDSSGLVDVDEEQEEAIEEVLELTLEESIEMALKNSPDIKAAEIEYEQAKVNLRRAEKDARDVRDQRSRPRNDGTSEEVDPTDPIAALLASMMGGGSQLYSYDTYLYERVRPIAMEMAKTLTEKGLENQKDALKLQVENAYYGVLKAERALENALDAHSRAKEQRRLAQVGFEVGVNAQLDVLLTDVLVASTELNVTLAENDLKTAKMEFNKLLSLPLDTEVKLTSSFSYKPVELNLDEIAQSAREKNIEYIQLHENYKVQEATFEVASSYYTPNVYTYQEVERNFEIAKLKLQNADEELDLKIKKAYFAAKTAEEAYKLMEKTVEQAEENYRLTKLKYEVGMATLLELENAAGELNSSKAELLAALYNYNSAITMLEHGLFF